MLIPYPFALLSSGAVFDLMARIRGQETLSQTGRHLTLAGLGTALVAAVPGMIDYIGTVPRRSKASCTGLQHAASNVSALLCFAGAARTRQRDGQLTDSGLALAAIGTGLLCLGGWLGGQLVYHETIGVDDSAPKRLSESTALAAAKPL
jgi:uncharacterized membrane protein